MPGDKVVSDQYFNWSDTHGRKNVLPVATTAKAAAAESGPRRDGASRLSDRALQALRQAGVQMRPGTRPWTEVLSVGQPPRQSSGYGLCAARPSRAGSAVPFQLPEDSGGSRPAVRDQSRTASASRTSVGVGDGFSRRFHIGDRSRGRPSHGHCLGQYPRSGRRGPLRGTVSRGGRR